MGQTPSSTATAGAAPSPLSPAPPPAPSSSTATRPSPLRISVPQPAPTTRDKVKGRLGIYVLGPVLGHGQYGVVRSATMASTKEEVCVKSVLASDRRAAEDAERECTLWQRLQRDGRRHPNVVRLIEAIQDQRWRHVVMEVARGGELFDRIERVVRRGGIMTEADVARLFTDVLHALAHCHSNGVAHRDVKLENLIATTPAPEAPLLLADFGFAANCGGPHDTPGRPAILRGSVGTPHYIAPEVQRNAGPYSSACDLYSAGVVLAVMLTGTLPPDDPVSLAEYRGARGDTWEGVSVPARQLAATLLSENPMERPSAEAALKHPWVAKLGAVAGERGQTKDGAPVSPVRIGAAAMGRLHHYAMCSKLGKRALAVIASRVQSHEIVKLRSVFRGLDTDESGTLSLAELHRGLVLSDQRTSAQATLELVRGLGLEEAIRDYQHHSASVTYDAFIAALLDKSLFLDEATLLRSFADFDTDQNGRITHDELITCFARHGWADKASTERALAISSSIGGGGGDGGDAASESSSPSKRKRRGTSVSDDTSVPSAAALRRASPPPHRGLGPGAMDVGKKDEKRHSKKTKMRDSQIATAGSRRDNDSEAAPTGGASAAGRRPTVMLQLDEARSFLSGMDQDTDGKVDYHDFCAWAAATVRQRHGCEVDASPAGAAVAHAARLHGGALRPTAMDTSS